MPDFLKRSRSSRGGRLPLAPDDAPTTEANALRERSLAALAPGRRAGARERARMRLRLREQQRVRQALLLDLGAMVFELQRQGRREPELLQAKAAELTAVDEEVRALADALAVGDGEMAIVATGIAGSCGACGALLSTDARFCSSC